MKDLGPLLLAIENHGPIDMVLHCPTCHRQHVDKPEPDWPNPPHRSHLCHFCGCVWRPADVPTNGVKQVTTRGQKDNWPPALTKTSAPVRVPPST